uniref:Uncharacterized protein n=1 Tax=Tanacetum cinerariifolium TaxID=118510 RepID=A0A6L2KZH8_TANCI|nr:hypothetical protein [Tanacetum cinerariifolium]
MAGGTMHVFYSVLVSLLFMSSLHGRSNLMNTKMVALLPLLKELVRAAESDAMKDQLIVLFERELVDIEKAARLLLMERETQIKVDEKTGFILRMRNHVVV